MRWAPFLRKAKQTAFHIGMTYRRRSVILSKRRQGQNGTRTRWGLTAQSFLSLGYMRAPTLLSGQRKASGWSMIDSWSITSPQGIAYSSRRTSQSFGLDLTMPAKTAEPAMLFCFTTRGLTAGSSAGLRRELTRKLLPKNVLPFRPAATRPGLTIDIFFTSAAILSIRRTLPCREIAM